MGNLAVNLKQRIYSISSEFILDATDPTPMIFQLSKLIKNNISELVYASEDEIEGEK